jgi:hypothetical protein
VNRRKFIGLLAAAPVALAVAKSVPEIVTPHTMPPEQLQYPYVGVDIGEGDYTVLTISNWAPSVTYKVGDRVTLSGKNTYVVTHVSDGVAYATDKYNRKS